MGYPRKRKTPIRHRVRSYVREHHPVKSFVRGKGTKPSLGIVDGVLRRFPDPEVTKVVFFDFLDKNLPENVTTVSGASDEGGIDSWIREYESAKGRKLKEFPPQFDVYGRPKAYYVRNQQIADEGKEVWAFLGPTEGLLRSGAMQTIRMARKQGKKTRVFRLTSKGVTEVRE
jgi:hypothetical protein